MRGYNITYNGLTLHDSTWTVDNSTDRILVEDFSPDTTPADQSKTPNQGGHGVIVSPRLLRGRLITINGILLASSQSGRDTLIRQLKTAFAPPVNPSSYNKGEHLLIFTDDGGNTWSFNAIVEEFDLTTEGESKDSPQEHRVGKFSVLLIAEDPYMIGSTLHEYLNGLNEGSYGGIAIPFTIGTTTLHDWVNKMTLNNAGVGANAPVIFTIRTTGTSTNPRIMNVTTNRWFGLGSDISPFTFTAGDEIVIDSNTLIVTKNGVNVSGDRTSGSQWIYLQPGDNDIVLVDNSIVPPYSVEMTADISYYDRTL